MIRLLRSTLRPAFTGLLGLALASILPTAAFARDSAWLLGDDGHVAVNILEHREGLGRQTEVTLIYGMHFLQGALHDVNSGKIVLKETTGGKDIYVFTGTISVDYGKDQLTLKGKLTETDAQNTLIASYDTKLKCRRLESDN